MVEFNKVKNSDLTAAYLAGVKEGKSEASTNTQAANPLNSIFSALSGVLGAVSGAGTGAGAAAGGGIDIASIMGLVTKLV